MGNIKSASRVLEVLEYFDSEHQTATVMDLSRSLGYPQSSTSELLRFLARLGFLHYDRFRRIYRPTARVALLGCWVAPTLFRGGTVIRRIDRIAKIVGETVVMSTAAHYLVQHIHVVRGRNKDSVEEQIGRQESMLYTPQGQLLLSSFPEARIRSILHRLNAEEENPERRVRTAEKVEELLALRCRGGLIQPEAREDGTGVVAMILPEPTQPERLVLSVLASREIIERCGEDILQIMFEQSHDIKAQKPHPLAQEPVAGLLIRRSAGRISKRELMA